MESKSLESEIQGPSQPISLKITSQSSGKIEYECVKVKFHSFNYLYFVVLQSFPIVIHWEVRIMEMNYQILANVLINHQN